MRKNLLKSLLLTLMVLSGVNAWGIEVATTYDFTTGTNGTTPTISTTAHHKTGNSTNVFLATDDICKSRFCFQAVDASNNHVFDFVNSKLQQLKGDRWFSVVDLKAGDKIAFTFTVANAGSSTDKHFTVENAGTGTTTNLSLTKGGDAIAANTDMVSETEYYVLADGYLDFKTRKNFYLTKVVITSEVGEETVSKPELSITGANLGARTVTIKRGESSLNNTTTTYYTIDGSAPTTASASSTTQYTPVLVGEGATEEATVTVKAISVSSGNVSSEVAELAVPVGTTIQLDAPTIAVTGMALNSDVYNPVFTFTGTQSVIGKPTATLSYSIDEGAATEGASCTVTAPGTLRVTVSAEGYASNYKDFVIKNATYTLSKTIDLSASDYVDVTGFGEGSANAHWANFGTMNATIYTLPETTSLPGITLNSVTYSQFSLGLGLGFASGTRTATINDTAEGEIGEFVLYTGGSLADEKNVSAFVEYNEGITFTLPVTGTAQALKKINVYTPKVEVPVFDPATAIVNADFSADEPIAQKICTYAKDVQEGQVANMQPLTGWTIVENGDARAAGTFAYGSTAILGGDGGNVPAVGPNGETEGKVLGLEAVWSATTQYTQEVTLPAGDYLMEAVIYNAAGTGALSSNLIGIDGTYSTIKNYPVGKWTKDQIKITLAEEKTVTVSIGVNSGNVGNGVAPHLFIDHIKLYGSEEIAAIELAAAKENASAEVNALPTGDALFLYPVDAVNTAKAAIETAATVDDVNAAVATAKAAQNKPAADKAYAIANATATGNLCITEGKVSVAKDAKVFFTAVEGGYVLSNETGDYIFKTDNDWTLSTTKEIASAYVVTIVPVEGGYTIKGAKGLFGLDSTDEGSTVYANKAQSNNGLWTIAEYVAPSNDYTSYIVNADLTGEGGFDTTGTKGIDGSGIVKVGSAAAFDFKQTIANLPAGKYRVTTQAAYRYGGDEQAEYNAMQTENTITKFVQLYATVGDKTVTQPVQNRYDGASETNLFIGEGGVSVVNEKFVPNSSDAVKAWFAAGKYVNEVEFNLPADGAVTIGINRTGTPESDYTVIGPWTLTRLGDAEVEPEPEPEPQPGQDMTKYITNPSFETGNANGWTYETSNDHGAKRNDNGTYTMTNCDGDYLFNIWSSGNAISQKIENLPNGTYLMKAVIATDAGQKVQLNANGKSVQIDAVDKGTGVEGELEFDVLNNTATIGAEGVNKYWYKVDNFRLTYVKGFDIAALKDIYKTALAEAQAITGNMSAEAKLALTAAIAVEVDTTDASALIAAAGTLTEAATTANASVAAYAKAKAAIDAAKAEMAATNVYTTEALEAYKAVYDAAEPKYEDGTLTDDEAKALENPTTLTGWHDATIVDNFLLSAWDTNPDFQDAPYYINTWSTEGNNDGSNFKVPFFEYWTGDANSLGENVLTATMTNLPEGEYDVTAWVRVRIKNGAEAPAAGITFQANEGEAVNVAAGDQVGTSQMYLKEFTATGTVAEDGVLKIKFIVAADNNISWLSFKNVKFEKKPVEVVHTWDFTKWSEATIANLKAEAAKVTVEADPDNEGNTKCTDNGALWSDHEKKPGTTCETYAVSKDNCFWYIGGEAEPTANGTAIAEFAGLEFNTTYGASRALAIAVNYPSTSLGTYNGPSYLWFGGKGQTIMTIPAVKGGTTITIGVESHKPTDARGIQLFAGETELMGTDGNAVAVPTTYTEQSWVVPAGVAYDIIVKNTNGCHIYFIDAEQDEETLTSISTMKSNNMLDGTIYNLNGQKVNKAQKGLYIINGKKVVIK